VELSIYAISMFIAAAIVFFIGFYAYKKIKSLEDYYVMGRNATALFIAGTFFATWLSVVTFVGEVGLGWDWGMPATLWTYASLWGATIFALLAGIPLRRAKFLTAPDFFETRFNSKAMRALAFIALFFGLFFYAVAQITGTAIALEVGTGLPYTITVIIVTILVGIYLVAGGMYSVIWTDLLMYITMVFAGLVAFPLVLNAVGGWEAITHELPKTVSGLWRWNGRQGFPLPFLLGNALVWLGVTASAPHLITRAYAAKDEKEFLKGMLIGSTCAGIFLVCVISLGQFAVLAAPYGTLPTRDYVTPFIARNLVPVWVGCLLFAGIMVAGMSTINTQMLTLAQGFVKDLYADIISRKVLSPEKVLLYTRVIVIILAILMTWISLIRPATVYVIGRWGGGIFCCTYLPILYIGLHWKRATKKGAIAGFLTGLILYTVLLVGVEWQIGMAEFTKRYILTANIWATIAAFIVTIVVSLLTKQSDEEKANVEKLFAQMYPPKEKRIRGIWPRDYILPIIAIIIVTAFLICFSYFLTL